MPRPTRVGDALVRHPASTTRVVSDAACPGPGYAGRVRHDPPVERLGRHAERGRSEREALDALLDEVLAGTLSTVVDGRPWVVPMLFARDGDRVLLHGSTGAGRCARWLRARRRCSASRSSTGWWWRTRPSSRRPTTGRPSSTVS